MILTMLASPRAPWREVRLDNFEAARWPKLAFNHLAIRRAGSTQLMNDAPMADNSNSGLWPGGEYFSQTRNACQFRGGLFRPWHQRLIQFPNVTTTREMP